MKLKENITLKIKDYKLERKGNASCYTTSIYIKKVDTMQIIEIFMNQIAYQYPDKQFMIIHDGMISLEIYCDEQMIFNGNYYDIEEMLKEDTYKFKEYLMDKIK